MPRLLLVDDEVKLVNSLKGFLEMQGFDVWIAPGGEEALQLVEQHQPDVVLLDLNLAGSRLSGMDVLRHVKQTRPNTIVFVVSGYTEDSTKAEVRQLGADGYCEKPLMLPDVLQLIQEALAKRP